MPDYSISSIAFLPTDKYIIARSSISGDWAAYVNSIEAGDRSNNWGNNYQIESGLRFRHLRFPSDAIITSAKLVFDVPGTVTIQTTLKTVIQAELSSNVSRYSGRDYDELYNYYTNKVRGDESVSWDITEWADDEESPDISDVIQELVDELGELRNIFIFWGDKGGNTVTPPAGTNWAWAEAVTLEVEFSSVLGVPTLPAKNNFNATDCTKLEFTLDIDKVFNDVRFIIPHDHYDLDTSVVPNVYTPVDYHEWMLEEDSINKYFRRTNKVINHALNSEYGQELCNKKLQYFKEPKYELKLTYVEHEAAIERILNTRIGDIYLLDYHDMKENFMVESINLTGTPITTMELGLRMIESVIDDAGDTVPKEIFRVCNHLTCSRAVIG